MNLDGFRIVLQCERQDTAPARIALPLKPVFQLCQDFVGGPYGPTEDAFRAGRQTADRRDRGIAGSVASFCSRKHGSDGSQRLKFAKGACLS